jgi:prevent-host-death family protein
MKTVNIGTLKNKLSAYLQDVRNGEEVIVQDRKKPIARIVPVSRSANYDEREELIAAGDLKPALEKMDWNAFWNSPAGDVSREAAVDAARWSRGDR